MALRPTVDERFKKAIQRILEDAERCLKPEYVAIFKDCVAHIDECHKEEKGMIMSVFAAIEIQESMVARNALCGQEACIYHLARALGYLTAINDGELGPMVPPPSPN